MFVKLFLKKTNELFYPFHQTIAGTIATIFSPLCQQDYCRGKILFVFFPKISSEHLLTEHSKRRALPIR
jgi:hypothetical protein